MRRRWEIGAPDRKKASQLALQGGITQLCAEVLVSRGIESVEEAGRLLEVRELSDPFLLTDMQRAADRILAAVDAGEQICVYGDYDCDGVTATVMLTDWLTGAGANVSWYVPTRAEGYGMRADTIRRLKDEGVQLIITVDTGISAVEEAKLVRELGMELVITDHHRPGDTLPEAYAVVDPYRPDDLSPYKTICGAGVVLRLIIAMDGDPDMAIEQFGDLAALGTIGDVMPLDGENRYLVRRGLDLLQNTERAGLLALMEVCGIEPGTPVSATNASFQLIPRINAAGRFATAALAVQLFLTDDYDDARTLAEQIHALNNERRQTEQVILEQILAEIAANPALLCGRVLTFAGEDWHHGVIGIVAARLTERFGKPCFLMSREPEGYRGSARGFGDFSVFEALHACAEHLIRYGGHPGAGGFTVSEAEKDAFCAALEAYAAEHHPVMPVRTVHAERVVTARDLTVENVSGLAVLEPFGSGNEKPLFVLEGVTVSALISLSGGVHTKLQIRSGRDQLDVLMFRTAPQETGIVPGMTVDFLVAAEVRPYQGRPQLTLRCEDWRISKSAQEQAIAALNAYESYRRGEQLPKPYYLRMCPHRADLVAVYSAVHEAPLPVAVLCETLKPQGMNYCRARICGDIFAELGLMQYDAVSDALVRLRVTKKRDLSESETYRNIRAMAGAGTAKTGGA